MAKPIHLIRLDLEVEGLYRLSRDHGYDGDDPSYTLHAALAALFGDKRPLCHYVEKSRSGRITVLAYSEHPIETLRGHAELFTDPIAYRTCAWDMSADKPMPSIWKKGMTLGFQVRLCPVVRPRGDASKEKDAYVHAKQQGSAGAREEVYRDHLAGLFARRGAELGSFSLKDFQLTQTVRRCQDAQRTPKDITIPDAMIGGTLTITDPEDFQDMLLRGVGRHRTFGFGMLLLRAP